MLENLKIPTDALKDDDSVGESNRPQVQDSGVYSVRLEYAYLEESKGGALGLKCEFVGMENPKLKFRQTFWLTSGKAKGQKNYYTTKEGKKRLLPDMRRINDLAIVAANKPLSELEPQKKVISLWNFEAGANKNTKVNMISELVGIEFLAGIYRTVENRREEVNGQWQPVADRREFNEADKFFNSEGFTAMEITGKKDTPKAILDWKKKWEGVVNDKYDNSAQPTSGDPKIDAMRSFMNETATKDDDIPF
jgi:hypothetical protein